MNIYVGNLDYKLTEEQLRTEFEKFGKVDSVQIITDKFSGRAKGFGFVEMSNNKEAEAAIKELNSKKLNNRALKVNESRAKKESHRNRNTSSGRSGSGGNRGKNKNYGRGGADRKKHD